MRSVFNIIIFISLTLTAAGQDYSYFNNRAVDSTYLEITKDRNEDLLRYLVCIDTIITNKRYYLASNFSNTDLIYRDVELISIKSNNNIIIDSITHFKNLEILYIISNGLRILNSKSTLPNLKSFSYSGFISDDMIMFLANQDSLVSLSFSVELQKYFPNHIENFKYLESLSVYIPNCTYVPLPVLSLAELKYLSIESDSIIPELSSELLKLENLETFSINFELNKKNIAIISQMGKLKQLEVIFLDLKNLEESEIKALGFVEKLRVKDASNLNHIDLIRISKLLPNTELLLW